MAGKIRHAAGVLCFALLMLFTLGTQGRALATEQPEVTPGAEYGTTGDTITATYTGHIQLSMMVLEVPASIAFEVDPELVLEENGFNQVSLGGSGTIVNRGGAVRLEVIGFEEITTSVTLDGETPETIPFTFFAKMADANALAQKPLHSGKFAGAMVSLWLDGDEPENTNDLALRALTPEKLTGSPIIIGDVAAGITEIDMNVYCYAKTNFIGRGFTFEVKPLIKATLLSN